LDKNKIQGCGEISIFPSTQFGGINTEKATKSLKEDLNDDS
jgi:hypothetical protein